MKLNFYCLLALSVAVGLTAEAASKTGQPVEATLKDGTGKKIGTAKITEVAKKGVKVHVDVEGLSPGEHAIHFHNKGTCTGPDFSSAGDHFSPEGKEHGFDHAKGPHAGDMRNITVGPDGKAKLDVMDERVTLGKGATSLLRPGGTSLVIHAKPDDYKTQPSGNSGDRLACAEIRGT